MAQQMSSQGWVAILPNLHSAVAIQPRGPHASRRSAPAPLDQEVREEEVLHVSRIVVRGVSFLTALDYVCSMYCILSNSKQKCQSKHTSCALWEILVWVADTLGVERLLNLAHQCDGGLVLRVVDVRSLHDTQAVFGTDGALVPGYGQYASPSNTHKLPHRHKVRWRSRPPRCSR